MRTFDTYTMCIKDCATTHNTLLLYYARKLAIFRYRVTFTNPLFFVQATRKQRFEIKRKSNETKYLSSKIPTLFHVWASQEF